MASSPTRDSEKTFTLFVVLPSEDVCTLRNLISGITVDEVKDRLELSAGIPSHLYILVYPDGECLMDNQRLLIQENIHDGYLLKIQLMEHWDSLYHCVVRNNLEHVYHNGGVHLKGNIVIGSDESEKVDHMVSDRGVVALFVASFHGLVKMCKMLLSVGVDVNGRTPFGRTPLHACVCKDNISVADVLIENGASADRADVNGLSAYGIACLYGSKRCIKRLRIIQLNLRGRKANSAQYSDEMERKRLLQRSKMSSEISKITVDVSVPLQRPATVHGPSYSRNKSALSVLSTDSRDTGMFSHFTISTPSKAKISFLNLKMNKNVYGNYRVGQRPDGYAPQLMTCVNSQKRYDENTAIIQGRKMGISFPNKTLNLMADDNGASVSPTRLIPDVKLPSTMITPSPSPSPVGDFQNDGFISDKEKINNTAKAQKNKKSVHFASRERPYKNTQRSENIENIKRMKRRINIVSNYNSKEENDEKTGEAYRDWLKKKTKENVKFRPETQVSEDSDESESSDDNTAFVEWLNKKKNSNNNNQRSYVRGGRPLPGLITVGSTEEGEVRTHDPVNNIRSYKNWVEGRKRSKKRHNVDRMRTVESFMAHKRKLEEKRQKLLIDAVSYEEWMDHTEDKKTLIREILQADLEQLAVIEAERIRKRAPKQIAYTNWKEKLDKREENEKIKNELQIKYQQEKDKWRKDILRSSRAISHREWCKLKDCPTTKEVSQNTDNENELAEKTVTKTVVFDKWLDTKNIEEINSLQTQIQEERKVTENYQQRMANLISCQ